MYWSIYFWWRAFDDGRTVICWPFLRYHVCFLTTSVFYCVGFVSYLLINEKNNPQVFKSNSQGDICCVNKMHSKKRKKRSNSYHYKVDEKRKTTWFCWACDLQIKQYRCDNSNKKKKTSIDTSAKRATVEIQIHNIILLPNWRSLCVLLAEGSVPSMSGSLVPHQISLRVRLAPGVPLSNHHHMFHSHLQRAYTHLTVIFYIFIFCRFVFPHGASSLPACFPSLWTLNGVDWWRRAICSIETVVLGGTHQKYDYNKRTCPFDAKFIYDGCVAKVAALKKCQVVEEWVGLRPGRKTVRLDCDQLVTGLYKSKVFSFFFCCCCWCYSCSVGVAYTHTLVW